MSSNSASSETSERTPSPNSPPEAVDPMLLECMSAVARTRKQQDTKRLLFSNSKNISAATHTLNVNQNLPSSPSSVRVNKFAAETIKTESKDAPPTPTPTLRLEEGLYSDLNPDTNRSSPVKNVSENASVSTRAAKANSTPTVVTLWTIWCIFLCNIIWLWGIFVNIIKAIANQVVNTWNAICQFVRTLLSPVTWTLAFVKNIVTKTYQWYRTVTKGKPFLKFLFFISPLLIGLVAMGLTLANSPILRYIFCHGGPRICFPDLDEMTLSFVRSKRQIPLFDRVFEVASVLTDSVSEFNEVLDLNHEARALQNIYQDGYATCMAASEIKAADTNTQFVFDSKDLQYYLMSLADTKVHFLPSVTALQAVAYELGSLHFSSGPWVRGRKTDKTLALENVLDKALNHTLRSCLMLEHKIAEGIQMIDTWLSNQAEIEEILKHNHQSTNVIRQRDWDSFTNRFWRLWIPKRSAAKFEARKAKEDESHDEGFRTLTRFVNSLQQLKLILESNEEKLNDVADRDPTYSAIISKRYLFKGAIADKTKIVHSLLWSIQKQKVKGQKAMMSLYEYWQ